MSATFNRVYLDVVLARKPRLSRHGVSCVLAFTLPDGSAERIAAVSTWPAVSTALGAAAPGSRIFVSGQLRTKPVRLALFDALVFSSGAAKSVRGPLLEEHTVAGYTRRLKSGRVIRVETYKRGGRRARQRTEPPATTADGHRPA